MERDAAGSLQSTMTAKAPSSNAVIRLPATKRVKLPIPFLRPADGANDQ